MKARLAALAALALAIPACGGDTQGSTQLFLETFDSGFPAGTWTAPTGLASAAIDTGTGSPPFSLKMSTATASRSVSTDTVSSFTSTNLTISVLAAIVSSPASLNGTATISIVNATPSVIATAVWDNAAGTITFTITGASGPVVVTAPVDGAFHRFVFNVTAGGVGNWTLDNGAVLLSQAVASSMLKIRLAADFGTGTQWPDVFYDSVTVSSP